MEQVPTDKKQRMPSSRVLEEVIDQAPADYFTGLADVDLAAAFVRHRHAVSWIARDDTGRLHGPGFMLAAMAVQLIAGRGEPVFPHFITTRRLPTRHLLRLGGRAILAITA